MSRAPRARSPLRRWLRVLRSDRLAVVLGGLLASVAAAAATAAGDALPRTGRAVMFVIDGVSVPDGDGDPGVPPARPRRAAWG